MDPLGFDRAYSSLADMVLPGLTNVAEEGEVGPAVPLGLGSSLSRGSSDEWLNGMHFLVAVGFVSNERFVATCKDFLQVQWPY